MIEVIEAEKTRTDINGGICSIDSYTTKSECESNNGIWWGVIEEKIERPVEESYTTIERAGYVTTQLYNKSSDSSASATSIVSAYTYDTTNKLWKINSSVVDTRGYYYLLISVAEPGYYKVCYNIPNNSNTKNSYGIYFKGNTVFHKYVDYSQTYSGCVDIGLTTETDEIKITMYRGNAPENATFYLTKANVVEEVSAGYRYEGKKPDNYIWFNNELWRIIGLIPTKDANGNNVQLVKIIKAESIGNLFYSDCSNTGLNSYTLSYVYQLLNNDYYMSNNVGCYITKGIRGRCNFAGIGLNDAFKYMIQPVQLTTGNSVMYSDGNLKKLYDSEISSYTNVDGGINIALMSTSDYGYSMLEADCARDTILKSYNTASCAGKSWLYYGSRELTLTGYSSHYLNVITEEGKIDHMVSYDGIVRPTLYLNENVYVISGTGTAADPYIIGM